MRFTIVAAAALLGAAIAAPAPQSNPGPRESISIQNFEAINKEQNGPVTSVYFELVSTRAAGVAAFVCRAEAAEGLKSSDILDCSEGPSPDGAYTFTLVSTAGSTFNLKVYHQTAPGAGLWGVVSVEGQCSIESDDSDVLTCRKDQTPGELQV
ncbi:hypothetical protein MGG_08797 [Pyricularia oryzae 70-15]|uniref:AA1-like domain-containing protein n=1 Tax=Pyricularia oryzae (strain 70-15 / ATCC MYA-4617 / FGSC 8958) TaxID=242507 RepID=G4NFK0_PYRO7|nr:uncharacterized protein MGG_08797 [Pyricularia oryzae 70-15]EHA46807.1 hypothetical protein MGG_08797 [Pyricularia oryzae 70-15]